MRTSQSLFSATRTQNHCVTEERLKSEISGNQNYKASHYNVLFFAAVFNCIHTVYTCKYLYLKASCFIIYKAKKTTFLMYLADKKKA